MAKEGWTVTEITGFESCLQMEVGTGSSMTRITLERSPKESAAILGKPTAPGYLAI
jgi:hypothetical protein